jgi:hypothetical protein
MLYRVDASLTASHLMSQIAGLRARVEEMLMGILETADAINQLQEINFESTVDAPMRVHVGKYIISYLLDVKGRKANATTKNVNSCTFTLSGDAAVRTPP